MNGGPKSTPVAVSVHDKCKQVIAFHNHVVKFFKSLTDACPEFKHNIAKCAKYYRGAERSKYITKTISLMSPHISRIAQYDEGIFSNDYHHGSMKLLPGLDMKEIFTFINESPDFSRSESAEIKKTIFNHLQSIYVTAQLADGQINKFNTAMNKQKQMLIDMLKNLNLDTTLKERVDQISAEDTRKEAENSILNQLMKGMGMATSTGGAGGLNLEKLGELFGEDNFIFQIAKDIADSINMDGDGDSGLNGPVDAINSLFANNGQKLQELIVMISEKIEQKIKNGEIDQDKFMADAHKMRENVEELVGGGAEGGMNSMFKRNYDELSSELQTKYSDIPGILSRKMSTWTAEEKELFDQFLKDASPQFGLPFPPTAGNRQSELDKEIDEATAGVDLDAELK